MEKYTFKGRDYDVDELSANCCTHAVMMAHPEWNDEEARKATFQIYHEFGVKLTIWPSRAQEIESVKSCLRDAYVSGMSASDIEGKRKELARLGAMTDDEWDKEQEDYLLNGYSDVELLSQAKDAKTREIEAYDTSTSVNSFTLGGTEIWLSFDERARIRQSIDAYRNEGRTEMTKWFGGKAFTFTLDTWLTMLDKLSVYASEALNVTEWHKAEVRALTSIEAVEEYDYKAGYPEKLSFANTPDAVITK